MRTILVTSLAIVTFFSTNGMMRRTHYDKRYKKKQPSRIKFINIETFSKKFDAMEEPKREKRRENYGKKIGEANKRWESGGKYEVSSFIKELIKDNFQLNENQFEELTKQCPEEFAKFQKCMKQDIFKQTCKINSEEILNFDISTFDNASQKIKLNSRFIK